jgi:hypothetical protein
VANWEEAMSDETPEHQVLEPQFFYVNAVHLTLNPFDITMDFAYHPSGHHGHHFHPAVRIAMSPSHAKSMLKILADRVASYEQEFGVIPSPHYSDEPPTES